MMLVSDSLTRNAARTPDRPCLLFGDRSVTWSELDTLVNRAANGLLGRGVRPSDFVSLLARNRVEHVIMYFATARIGAVLSPVNYWLRDHEVRELLAEVRPRLVVTEPEWFDAARDHAAGAGIPAIAFDEASAGFEVWDDVLAAAAPDAPGISIDDASPHIVFYTSGSTGNPKGVLKTHRGHVRNAMQFALALGLDENDRGICGFPLFNVGGYESILHKFFFLGGSVVLLPRFDPAEVLRAIERDRVTVALFNPTHFRLLLDCPELDRTDLSSLRLCYIGGMVAPESLLREVAERFGVGMGGLFHLYGQSEGPPLITMLSGADCERKIGSIGRPVPGVDMRLFDAEDREVVGEGTGEIRVRADDVMVGYLGNPTATAAVLSDGWLRTGDVGRRDPDGYYYIVGRLKDLIRSGGQSVFPSEIEPVLCEHPGIVEASVIGTPDPTGVWGEEVCAVLVAAGDPPAAEEVQAFVRDRLAGYKVPKRVEYVDAIPTLPSQKIDKAALRKRFGTVFDAAAGQ